MVKNNRRIQKDTKLISNNKIIIFQDYDKGVISKELIEEISKIDHLFIAVDPKKRNFFK